MDNYGLEEESFEVSRMKSFLAWNEANLENAPKNEDGICLICGGTQYSKTEKHGLIYCKCFLEKEVLKLNEELKDYRSKFVPKNLDDLIKWGSPNSVSSIIRAKKTINKWLDHPSNWITIIGGTGSGKSHILSYIAGTIGSWGLYITASDFEAHLTTILDSDNEMKLSYFIDVVRSVPFLIFDDLGSEYVKTGRDWVRSNLRKVIDYRYLRNKEYPTIIATNLNSQDLINYDMRIGSRILDSSICDVILLSDVQDFRRRGQS